MAENLSSFLIGLDGDGASLSAALAKITRDVKSAASEIERSTKNIELFKGTEEKVREAEKAFVSASEKVAAFREQMLAVQEAGPPTREQFNSMAVTLKTLTQEAKASATELDKQRKALTGISTTLTKAGVDVTKLADEEKRLATETAAATKAQAEQQARATLGVKSTKETADAIAKLNAAYATLKNSGTASTKELAEAQKALIQKTNELREGQGGLVQSLTAVRTSVLAGAAAFTGFVAGLQQVIELGRQYQLNVARLGTVSTASQGEIRELGEEVRRLSASLGFDLTEGLKAAYDLLRQGVPAGNIIEVLSTADEAAKAGLTDLGTAAKLTGILMRGFGLDVTGAKAAMDQAFVAAQNGGASFAELSDGLGSLAPLARSLNVPFSEVAASLQVMTRAGLDAPTALTQLQQILIRLGDRGVVARLKDLGIESKGLVGTLQQLAERRLGVNEILDLGVSSTRAAAGVAALTRSAVGLGVALEKIEASSGAIAKANANLEKTNAESIERLASAYKSLATNVGQTILPSSRFNNLLAESVQLLDRFVSTVAKSGSQGLGGFVQALVGTLPALGAIVSSFNAASGAIGLFNALQSTTQAELTKTSAAAQAASASLATSLGSIASAIDAQLASADKRIADLRTDLQALVPDLAASAKAIQDATAAGIAAINQQAQTRIAALDTLTNSERDIAAKTSEIQKQSATDRLKLLNDTNAQVLAAANAEAQARIAVARSAGRDIAKVEIETAQARAGTLKGLIAGYQSYLTELVSLETAHQNKIKDLQTQRVTVNRDIETQIRDLRNQSLSEFDKYYVRVSDIDKNISLARQALAAGDLKAAQDYATKAIEASQGIAKKVEQAGEVVVSQFTAQETAIGKLKSAQEVLNKVYDERIASETKGASETKQNVEQATLKLADLKKQLDAINATVAEGIQIKLDADATKVQETINKLTTETAERSLLLGLKIKVDEAEAALPKIKSDLENGLTVDARVKLDKVQEAINTIAAAKPELNVDTEAAGLAVASLGVEVKKLSEPVTVVATVNSNVGEVQSQIDDLKKPTYSTHTVTIKRVEANAAGGVVGEQIAAVRRNWPAARETVQRFAGGGPVFRRPQWTKVPGVGNGDTVPAALQSGAFVMRKAASQFYGDGLMSIIAGIKRFAGGGSVGGKGSDYFGDINSDSDNFREVGAISPPTLPRERDELLRLLDRYIRDVFSAAGLIDGYSYWKPAWDALALDQERFQRSPTDDNLEVVIRRIRNIGLNLGVTRGDRVGFDIDGRKWHRTYGVNAPPGLASLGNTYEFYAKGGAAPRGTDTVPAMLTPGEFVINRRVVSRLGEGFMHAVNSMRFSRESLAAMLRGPAAPQRTHYFAEGGMVGASMQTSSAPGASTDAGTINVTIQAAADSLLSPDNVRRFIVPILKDQMRRRAN